MNWTSGVKPKEQYAMAAEGDATACPLRQSRHMRTFLSRYAINERARAMMESLEPDEEVVLQLRFGAGQRIRTHAEVAELLSRSPAAVQQIEQHALRKLRLVALGPVSDGWEGWDEA